MTNLEKWKFLCTPYPSPETFIESTWLWAISAALQRRVWMDSDLNRVFANQYMLLVGEPGCGKSLVVSSIRKIFEAQYVDGLKLGTALVDTQMRKGKLLFPLSASSTSFESFVEFTANNTSTKKHGLDNREFYVHCSPAFILDEAASIFDKDAGKMATFLLEGWNCSDIYNRSTIGRGEDMIHNLCVNFLAGIQPGKLAELSKSSIVDNGFSRRCLMVYGAKPRFYISRIVHTPGMKEAYYELFPHIRALSQLYGHVKVSQEVDEYMDDIFVNNREAHINKSPSLLYYYTTKQVHLKKLAMAYHFSESLAMEVGLVSFKRAKLFLDSLEVNMHHAYEGTRDVRGELLRQIKDLLRIEPAGLLDTELYVECVQLCDYETLQVTLRDLINAGQIKQNPSRTYQLVK